MNPDGILEREVKLGAWPGMALPDLDGVADGLRAEPLEAQDLDATYWDTADLRLARWGASLRYRTGDGEARWTLKLPEGDGTAALVRAEFDFVGGPERPPTEARPLLLAVVRGGVLTPAAHLRTWRRRIVLRRPDGHAVAEIADDEVSVLDAAGQASERFRELEVELCAEGDDTVLDAVVSQLRRAGAGAPDPTPKVVRALGARATSPPDVREIELSSAPTAAEVIRAGIAAAVLRILRHDPVVRLDVDPEGVHQARVGTRRLRSDLRTFRPLLDTDWSEPLRDELRWLAAALGRVRDADVLLARLRHDARALPEQDRGPALGLLSRLERERRQALEEVLVDMESDRYVALLNRLVDAANHPRVLPAAQQPAHDLLPGLVRGPWRKLRKAVKRLDPDPPDEELHQVRIAAKRARYAADVVAPVVGDAARRHAKAIARVQDVLGEHHDAAVAEAWIREAVDAGASREQALAAGLLIAQQRADAEDRRREWPAAWEAASAKAIREWLA